MMGDNLKPEFVGEDKGQYTINCLIDTYISSIECSMVLDDEFETAEGTDEIDERNEWEILADENNINWLVEKLRYNGEKMERKFVEKFYNDFVRGEMIYHRPEDSETLNIIIKNI